jgi:mRNA (guanine-N7-)-methyltransferase
VSELVDCVHAKTLSCVSASDNRREDVGVKGRENSRIFPLRKFNNWIKSVIIGRFARPRPDAPGSENNDDERSAKRRRVGGRVLELGCGKGGDLAKWERARASELVMIDIAAVSVDHARARYLSGRHCYTAEFLAFDCFSVRPFSLLQCEVVPDISTPRRCRSRRRSRNRF